MTKSTAGLRRRRRPDALELLARARPASLDPGARAQSPAEAAASLAASGRPLAGPAAVPRPARLMPRTAVLAGTGLTAAAGAVAVAVLATSAGGAAAPGTASGHGRTHAPVLVAAAMVRQMASTSQSAMALSGRAMISYRNSQAGKLLDAGTDDITYSGKNWNDSIGQSFPAANGQPASTQVAINRIVGKQSYLYIKGRTNKMEWYRDTNPNGHPSFTIPDPRTVFSVLEPSARFEFAGYQVINGLRLEHLRATSLGHLRGLSSLPDLQPGRVTALDVWVDTHSVVHRLTLATQSIAKIYPLGSENIRRKPDGTLIVTVPNKQMAAAYKVKQRESHGTPRMIIRIARHPAAPRREVRVSGLTVSFSSIGQPQHITAPAHAIDVYGRG